MSPSRIEAAVLAGDVAERDAQVAVLASSDDGHVARDGEAAPLPVRPEHHEYRLHGLTYLEKCLCPAPPPARMWCRRITARPKLASTVGPGKNNVARAATMRRPPAARAAARKFAVRHDQRCPHSPSPPPPRLDPARLPAGGGGGAVRPRAVLLPQVPLLRLLQHHPAERRSGWRGSSTWCWREAELWLDGRAAGPTRGRGRSSSAAGRRRCCRSTLMRRLIAGLRERFDFSRAGRVDGRGEPRDGARRVLRRCCARPASTGSASAPRASTAPS